MRPGEMTVGTEEGTGRREEGAGTGTGLLDEGCGAGAGAGEEGSGSGGGTGVDKVDVGVGGLEVRRAASLSERASKIKQSLHPHSVSTQHSLNFRRRCS